MQFCHKMFGLPANSKKDRHRFIRDLVTQLFWLRNFGKETAVGWKEFAVGFGKDYHIELLDSPVMRNFQSALLKARRFNDDGDGGADAPEEDMQVTTAMLDSFVSHLGLGLLHSFQEKCDPGTVLLSVGMIHHMVVQAPPHHHRHTPINSRVLMPQRALLGEHIIQVRLDVACVDLGS